MILVPHMRLKRPRGGVKQISAMSIMFDCRVACVGRVIQCMGWGERVLGSPVKAYEAFGGLSNV